MRRILSVIVNDHLGVLNRITGLFLRRGFNIDSITVGKTETEGLSRMTIVVNVEDERTNEQIIKQLHKQIDVIKVIDITNEPSVERELVMIKVLSPLQKRTELTNLIEPFRASIIDVSLESVTIQATGNPEKIEALIELLRPYGIKELARTGVTAFKRGGEREREVTRIKHDALSLI
ncbi:acetolactate synthase-1/3 small subunit [Caldalkalibacillus uzonensis]|uniref:Acetolactate synthase small subunit n=1 Tax=Caldalkalibacillus uzonensis TaxID=353224 RepID=A0ABU0CN34_9BACI|nr:acetolactate synthase small subunit [Caldalkalibacillus uzonensis]MDQ0337820.1 acetolactate synthase-1/3 small subunit [Caldalkalibacillus uzonensis]